MKKYLSTFLIGLLVTTSIKVSAQSETEVSYQPVQIGFIYPLGTGGISSSTNSYNFSFNMLGGITGRTKGLDLSSLFNINSYSSQGVQVSSILNLAGSSFNNFEASRNIQISCITNMTRSGWSTQFAGVNNIADTAFTQVSSIFNFAKKSALQISTVNLAKNANIQLGVVNIAKKTNTQIGIVNLSRKSDFQLGVVNISDTARFMLGLINISKHGGLMQVEVSYDNFLQANAAFRSGIPAFYGIISTGYNFSESFWSVGAGIGTNISFGKLGLNLEAVQYSLHNKFLYSDDEKKYNGLVQFKPSVNYSFGKFQAFAGPTANLSIFNSEKYKDMIPYNLLDSENKKLSSWIGFSFGLRFNIL